MGIMRKLTFENMDRAVSRNFERRCKVSLAGRKGSLFKFIIHCDKGHRHTVEIQRRADGLYGDCYFAETGEECPSEMGGRVCYHRSGAAALFLALERGVGRRRIRRVRKYGLGDCALIGSAVLQPLPRFGLGST